MLPKNRLSITLVLFIAILGLSARLANAQVKPTNPAPTAATVITNPFATTNPLASPSVTPSYIPITGSQFVEDRQVTVVIKNGIRADDFLDWVLIHGRTASNGFAPIKFIQQQVVKATYAFAILVIIGIGYMLMLRRNKDITLMKFLPLFIGLMIYVFLSYPIVKNVYYINEQLMRGFMRIDNTAQAGCSNPFFISSCNLLHIGPSYQDYVGASRTEADPAAYEESALNTLLLVKVTTWTYMTLAGILVLRQVILWFFIMISPLLALLIPFPLLRNTAKIWLGEFFRWLLYGTLFSIFLRGLVELWRFGIPMGFIKDTPETWSLVYPTSIRILLAGPNYTVDPGKAASTSLNNPDTYANYVVALIMLWVIIILPWVLLRIFRDMLGNWLKSEGPSSLMGQLGNIYAKYSPLGPKPSPGVPASPPPTQPSPAGAGNALQLPFRQVNIMARDVAVNQNQTIANDNRSIANSETQINQSQTSELMKYIGMQMPKLTDIAKMEMNAQNLTQGFSTLQKLGNPNLAATPQEVQRVATLRSELTRRAENGDTSAQSMLQAAQSAAAISTSSVQSIAGRAAIGQGAQMQATTQGAQNANAAIAAATASLNPGHDAAKIVAQARAGAPVSANGRVMPVVNRVQAVSVNDYEEVKKMWAEHYRKGDMPAGTTTKNKQAWIKTDIEKAEQAVAMLGNMNPAIKQKGLEAVAALLPFLLLGGFSEQETITYLKAKIEAAKQVLTEMQAKEAGLKEGEASQDESVEVENKKTAHTEGHLAEETPQDEPTKPLDEAPQSNTVDAEAIENQLPNSPTDDTTTEK